MIVSKQGHIAVWKPIHDRVAPPVATGGADLNFAFLLWQPPTAWPLVLLSVPLAFPSCFQGKRSLCIAICQECVRSPKQTFLGPPTQGTRTHGGNRDTP